MKARWDGILFLFRAADIKVSHSVRLLLFFLVHSNTAVNAAFEFINKKDWADFLGAFVTAIALEQSEFPLYQVGRAVKKETCGLSFSGSEGHAGLPSPNDFLCSFYFSKKGHNMPREITLGNQYF